MSEERKAGQELGEQELKEEQLAGVSGGVRFQKDPTKVKEQKDSKSLK